MFRDPCAVLHAIFMLDSPAVMQRITDSDVPVEGNRNQVPDGNAASHDDEKEAKQAPMLAAAEIWAEVEGQMVRQGEADEDVGDGQR